ncbi:hypothetical protein [Salegentibacter sp. F14]
MKIIIFSKGKDFHGFKDFLLSLCISTLLISCNWNNSNGKDSENLGNKKTENVKVHKDSTYIVDVKAVDYAFGMPTEIPSGWITFRMENLGEEVHHGVIAKFVDTLSYQVLSQMISNAIAEATPTAYDPIYALMEKDYGGPAMLSPGLTGQTTVYLEPGLYTLSCHLKTPKGVVHKNKGMDRPFIVTDKKVPTEKPKTTVDLTLSNFAIDVGSISAGEQVFNVQYEDYNYHNVHLTKLEKDQKMEDLKVWMTEAQMPSPFKFIGGAEQVPAGKTSTFKATLKPGRYALVAFGQSIAGMAQEISIPKDGASQPRKSLDVNKKVRITLNLKDTSYPQNIPTGRTPVSVENTGSQDYSYILVLLKKGFTKNDLANYLEDAIVAEKMKIDSKSMPSYHIWDNIIPVGEKETFSLKVEEREYVVVGPLIPGKSLKSQWRDENLIHSFKGVTTN